jgi:hypothetical protein
MRTARAAGFFWLMTFVAGSFAMFALDGLKTASNVAAHEPLFRAGLVADLLATLCYIAATLLVYELLKVVSPRLSLAAAAFSLIGCAGSVAALAFGFGPLSLLASAPAGFTAGQAQGLALTLLRLRAQTAYLGMAMFGLHCLLVGVLIVRSRFLPRLVGALMVLAGLGWLTFSFSNLLAPAFAKQLMPAIMLPGMLGEGALSLWLLVMGVDVVKSPAAATAMT